MTNKFERILLSILIGTSVLLGLSFWLNIIYGFNLFYSKHWDELAKLQAEHAPISTGFYASIGIAILIFILGLIFVYVPKFKHKTKQTITEKKTVEQKIELQTYTQKEINQEQNNISNIPIPQHSVPLARPPRLNLPTNMAQIVAQKHQQQNIQSSQQPKQNPENSSVNPYNSILAEMFAEKGYTIKPNQKISGFTPNLFAIGPDEILWIGGIDQDITKLQSAVDKLQSLFEETLEDITININPFMLYTTDNQQTSDSITIFKSVKELKEFISGLPAVPTEDAGLDKSNFEAYSEYIDTIIQYLKSTGS